MSYFWVSVITTLGFGLLAAVLLIPVYLFLRREEAASEAWTPERLAERRRENAKAKAREDAPPEEAPPPTTNGTA